MQVPHLRIHPSDNIEVALASLSKGDRLQNGPDSYTLQDNIPAKHKFAIQPIPAGGEIIMYGVLVGIATQDIPRGGLISTRNIRHASGSYSLKERNLTWKKPSIEKFAEKTFMGFHRPDGSVGTANYWVIIPLVFCENKNVSALQDALVRALGYQPTKSNLEVMAEQLAALHQSGKTTEDLLSAPLVVEEFETRREKPFPRVDGIKFLNHTLGCGGTREDARSLCGLLAGYITHPNVAGATVLSLGCQNAQVSILQEEIFKRDPAFAKPLYILEQQQLGSESLLLEAAVRKTMTGLILANTLQRQPAPLHKLCLGLECGGSDGFSGISANPAVGYCSDLLVALGGSVILSEFPELCGVEQELSDRCHDEATARRFMELMRLYNDRAEQVGSGFFANPSPGNIKDGLITDAIKSAGAARKGGTSPIKGVWDYPEKVQGPGLHLLCTPGGDIESTTAEVGAGANIVLFTTGLGTPTGNVVAPVIKISTNSELSKKMNDIIDIDTGSIIEGLETIEQAGERILEFVIRVASGELQAKADQLQHDDFIPWKRGISL